MRRLGFPHRHRCRLTRRLRSDCRHHCMRFHSHFRGNNQPRHRGNTTFSARPHITGTTSSSSDKNRRHQTSEFAHAMLPVISCLPQAAHLFSPAAHPPPPSPQTSLPSNKNTIARKRHNDITVASGMRSEDRMFIL
jgi:hypothetical protein